MVTEASRGQCLEALHPVVLPVLQEASLFLFGESRMFFHLFNEGESSVLIEAVPREGEVVVKGSPCGAVHIMAVCVDSEICWRFALAHVLGLGTLGTVPKIDGVPAPAVEVMSDLQFFAGGVAGECLR